MNKYDFLFIAFVASCLGSALGRLLVYIFMGF